MENNKKAVIIHVKGEGLWIKVLKLNSLRCQNMQSVLCLFLIRLNFMKYCVR